MSDSDEEADEGPAVALGDGPTVAGAPLSRLAARLTWPVERSEIIERLGDEELRTAEGPVTLAEAMADVEDTYFGTRRHFVDAVRAELPDGPVKTD